ncbi:MAG TPA: hypothetical protein VHG51_17680 [Longimicrobiaceae bacterium]|nr:hypothetical protein [Longimicrobiaceae bacterium]
MTDPTAVAQAILAVPGALLAAKDMLGRRQPDVGAALGQLDTVQYKLAEFAKFGSVLDEVKTLHQLLQAVDTSLQDVWTMYVGACAEGFFSAASFPLGDVRRRWYAARRHSVNELIEFFGRMEHATDTVKHDFGGYDYRRIPRWAVQTVRLKNKIDEHFARIDRTRVSAAAPLTEEQVLDVAVSLQEFVEHVRARLISADREIRDAAGLFGNVLSRVAKEMENGQRPD